MFHAAALFLNFSTRKELKIKHFSFNYVENHFLWEGVGIAFLWQRENRVRSAVEFLHPTMLP